MSDIAYTLDIGLGDIPPADEPPWEYGGLVPCKCKWFGEGYYQDSQCKCETLCICSQPGAYGGNLARCWVEVLHAKCPGEH